MNRFISLAVFACTLAFSACANAELENKVTSLEGENASLKKELDGARRAQTDLREQLKVSKATPAANTEEVGKTLGVKPGEKLYATFETSMGTMVAELFWEKAPNTVTNFVQLAEGTKEWTDPKTNQKVKRPLYDGTIFHRVIPDFMIQGGDPLGLGTGGPGYRFPDEFNPALRHVGVGVLSMANSGPNSNGSQFFITEKDTPWLDNKHSVFGKVVEGLELVPKITRVEKDPNDRSNSRPKVAITLKKVRIGRGTPSKG